MTTAVGRDGFPAYTLHQWAKSDRSEPGRIHLLEHHLADVGACFEALLGQPTIRKRLARTGGREDLDRATVSRLSVLAALHDIGKVNMGFQTQIWRPEDLPGGRVPASFRRVGHTRDTMPVLDENGDTETSGWFFPALGFDEMLAWDDRDGLTAYGMFVATLSHHGLPLSLEDTLPANSAVWRSFGGLDPQECVGRIAGLVREWFPDAFGGNGEALPPQPAFQHMFLGLCTLADWIGSDEGWFEYWGVPEDGYMAHARRQARRGRNAITLPNPYEVILTTTQNERVELPWDFVRHYCDLTYRPRMEMIASEGRQVLGARVRALREYAGLTQKALAGASGIGRVTLVRLENGKHIPKLGTLRAIAHVLEVWPESQWPGFTLRQADVLQSYIAL